MHWVGEGMHRVGGRGMHVHPVHPPWVRPCHEGCVRKVLQEDGCSIMYSNYHVLSSCNIMYSRNVLQFLHSGNLIHNIDWCLLFAG
jgi:hypothetical protein